MGVTGERIKRDGFGSNFLPSGKIIESTESKDLIDFGFAYGEEAA
jgi:hypothetical protein